MKILIITKYEWDNGLAGGNTLTNLFGDWSDVELYNIYCRDAPPCNACCHYYYTVSPIDLVKHIFTPWKIGREFTYQGLGNNNTYPRTIHEASLKKMSKRYQLAFDIAYDLLYSTRAWLNKRLKIFIQTVNPDLVFLFGTPDSFNYLLAKYLKKKAGVPIVAYFVDDHYNKAANKYNLFNIWHKKRLKKTAEMASKCYAISQQMCDEYSFTFNKSFSLLFKGCDLSGVKTNICTPIKIVYAGNLYYGRDVVLTELAKAIAHINAKSQRVHLDIYSSTVISKEISSILNRVEVSSLHSPRPYEEIKRILHEADIVLHVESFDKEQINSVRLSFSTKITDCIQSGAKVLAIGPHSIASIRFLETIPGVTVVTDMTLIIKTLQGLLQSREHLYEDALATYSYASTHLTKECLTKRFRSDLFSLIRINS